MNSMQSKLYVMRSRQPLVFGGLLGASRSAIPTLGICCLRESA